MKQYKHYIIYKITNLVNGKIYKEEIRKDHLLLRSDISEFEFF